MLARNLAFGTALLLLPTTTFAEVNVVPNGLIETMGRETADMRPVAVSLVASLGESGSSMADTIEWSVFERTSDTVGDAVATGSGPTVDLRVSPGSYVAHVALAGTTTVRPFEVASDGDPTITIPLEIGALRLFAEASGRAMGADEPVSFSLYDTDGDRHLIRSGIVPGSILALPAGLYRAVVRYGDHNALTGADIRVRDGEIIEATLGVRGAKVDLALVRSSASDAAVADVSWRLFDSGGKTLLRTDEPRPGLVLAPGNYTAEVMHGDWTTIHQFEVGTQGPVSVRVPLERGSAN